MRLRDWFKWTGMMTLLYATFFLFASCSAQADQHKVVVRLKTPAAAEVGAVRTHQIRRAQMGVARLMRGHTYKITRTYTSLPYIAMTVDDAGLLRLNDSAQVLDVSPDHEFHTQLLQSVPLIGADKVHAKGVTGKGYSVAIIDTGVDLKHARFAGRIVAEACFTNLPQCPNGTNRMIGPGAGAPCTGTCYHGTHVADISGTVAPDANIVSVQVFTIRASGGVSASFSDIMAGIEWVASVAKEHNITALNMSLGGGVHLDDCTSAYQGMSDAADLALAQGVGVVAAAGNNGSAGGISTPACIKNHMAIGCTSKTDSICSFSNRGLEMDVWAPGLSIVAAAQGGGTRSLSGTSMSAPHVAGAFALVRQMFPSITAAATRSMLKTFGSDVAGRPRLRVDNIVAAPPDPNTPQPPDPNQPGECPTVCLDADGDGEYDRNDWCAKTLAGRRIDSRGCSHEQYCASIKTDNWKGRRNCRKSDWMNDEPRGAKDCKIKRDRSNRRIRMCVPR